MSVYLGLDASTQSLTATLISCDDAASPSIVAEISLNYDETLPEYGTAHGVLRTEADPLVITAPPLMWVEALDRVIARLCDEQPGAMSRLQAVSGSAQQHGSVYLNGDWLARIGGLAATRPLAAQLRDVFSRSVSPVWMDSSTTRDCGEIERAVGGMEALTRTTGSRAFERFTGPQIRAFARRDPGGYERTARIHLVSSFHASLLAGSDAPIDHGDGSGMNLMDIWTRSWWPAALGATAPDLSQRLPPVSPSWTLAGRLAPYWRERHGLPDARVVAWSGDNPCSLIGSGLIREGQLGISLGTSDTVCGMMTAPRFHDAGAGYVSASPTGEYMGTTVFKNGSLARERIRDEYGLDWAGFSAALRSTPPGNGGAMLLPWFDPEITPHVITPGIRRLDLDPANGPANVRALVEAQMMAMANHTRWMSADTSVVFAMGGASANRDVLQVMADVFGAEVVRARSGNAAALGAALRAWHADLLDRGQPLEWEQIVGSLTAADPAWHIQPRADAVAIYSELRQRYAAAETDACK